MVDDRERRAAAFASAVRGGLLDGGGRGLVLAVDELGAERSLAFEIGVCRLLMSRLLTVDGLEGDARRLARALGALQRALSAAVRLQWQIEAEGGSSMSAALTALLIELDQRDG